MYEIYVLLFSIVFWGLIYQLVIIPRTAAASFSVWRKKLKEDPEIILDVCEPLLEEIAEMFSTNFQSFWGSVSQLGKKAEGLDPNIAMKKAIAKGDLFQVLAEYVGNKAGLGQLQGLIQAKEEQNPNEKKGFGRF
jgi:hypothetical protein